MTKTLLTTAAVLALLPSASWADDIVVTATRAEQAPGQVGQSITTLDAATLEARQTPILADILTTTPGVTIARNGGVGSTTSLFIRGASSEHTLIVIDGVRVNDPSTPGGSYDFGNLLAGDVGRIEILRGADSVPWGSAAIGGVVNISTFGPTSHLSGTASAEGGSYGTSSVNAHVADSFGPFGLSVGGGWYHTSGISAFAKSEGGKEADGFDQHYANARLTAHLNDHVWLDLRGRYARGNGQIDGFNNLTFSFGDDAEFNTTRELNGYAGIHADFGTIKNTLGYSITNIHRNTYDPTLFSYATLLEFAFKGQEKRAEYQGDWQIARWARLAFGAEAESSSFYGYAAADNFGDPATTNAYSTHQEGAYGQAILTPISRLTITGGLRYDHHKTYGGHTTFSANGAYKLTDTTIVRASYAEGFKAPTLYQIYADQGVFTVSNPALRPETSTGYDVGIEQSALNGAVRARATYFNRHTHDLITYGFAPASACSSGFCGQYQNVARATAEGVELELAVHPVAAFTVSTNYTYTRSIDATTGLNLARRPRSSLSFNADWDAKFVKLGGSIQMVGGSYDNASNTVPLQSYVLVGLRGSVPINTHLELYGRIDNLFDEQYQVVKHYGTLGRAAYAGVRVKI